MVADLLFGRCVKIVQVDISIISPNQNENIMICIIDCFTLVAKQITDFTSVHQYLHHADNIACSNNLTI